MLKELINKNVLISIGEPWDFVSNAGENILTGYIDLVSGENGTEWLRCNISPFSSKGNIITNVVAVKRYADQNFNSLLVSERITSNLLYEPTGRILDSDQIAEVLQEQTGMNFLVGSVQLAVSAS
ncbi:hypothetical protein [Candidatus Electronema sp. JC]|uniref:hypothetical protein n=1 Tax=Candidatus Electronema sp. JC TaxID=3401570 RepID=UPI003B427BCE